MMLCYHCFLPVPGNFDGYSLSFFPFTATQVSDFATFCKICVCLFAFVSGYGLFFSFRKWRRVNPDCSCARWLWQRYVRTFSSFWLIVVLCWIVCGLIDGRPKAIYLNNSRIAAICYALLDIMGVSRIMGTPFLINTWWYMGAALIFIVTTPLLYEMLGRFGSTGTFLLLIIVPRVFIGYPGSTKPLSFLPVFSLGMIFAKNQIFDRIEAFINGRTGTHICLGAGFVFISVVLFFFDRRLPNNLFWDLKWGVFPIAYVICIFLTFIHFPVIKQILQFLGKHSANIFMVHTFIRDTYCRPFIYGQGHFLLVILTLLAISLLVSFLIEGLKKLILYGCFIAKLETLSFSLGRTNNT